MNVDKAEALLALAEAEEAFLVEKAAYRKDPKRKPAYKKAEARLVAARDEWRLNWRDSEE